VITVKLSQVNSGPGLAKEAVGAGRGVERLVLGGVVRRAGAGPSHGDGTPRVRGEGGGKKGMQSGIPEDGGVGI